MTPFLGCKENSCDESTHPRELSRDQRPTS